MYLELAGPTGSQYPMDWGARRHVVQTTNSRESEAIAWGAATKSAIKLAAMVEYTRPQPVAIKGHIDNQAIDQAIKKGFSQKLGHLKKHAEVSLRLLYESDVIPEHMPGPENIADMFTKPLAPIELTKKSSRLFGIPFEKLDNGSARAHACAVRIQRQQQRFADVQHRPNVEMPSSVLGARLQIPRSQESKLQTTSNAHACALLVTGLISKGRGQGKAQRDRSQIPGGGASPHLERGRTPSRTHTLS